MTNLDEYNNFVASDNRTLDSRRWKQIKQREKFKVYAERLNPSSRARSSDIELPIILCVGSVEGELEDLMFGVMSNDLETMRIKASYVDDVSGTAVLDFIVLPTLDDPFQTLIVKWMEIDIPFASMNFVKNRDYVCHELCRVRARVILKWQIEE